MANQIKFNSKHEISEDFKKKFMDILKQYDPDADIEEETKSGMIINFNSHLTDEDLDKVVEKVDDDNLGDFILDCTQEDKDEEDAKPVVTKDLFDTMNEELNMHLHNRMVEEKAAKGWKFGAKYDMDNKESPLMRAYHDLPESYRKPNKNILKDVIKVLESNGFILVHKH